MRGAHRFHPGDPRTQPLPHGDFTHDSDCFQADPAVASLFTALITSIFSAGVTVRPGYGYIESAVSSTVGAVLDLDRPRRSGNLTLSEELVLDRARAIVASRAADARLTMHEIADAASVSRSYLYRVFSKVDTTPRSYLREVRAARAKAQLAQLGSPGISHVVEIARRNGFKSVRAMQLAIHEDPDTTAK